MSSTRRHWLRRALLCALTSAVATHVLAQSIETSTIKFAPSEPTASSGAAPPLALPALPDWPDQRTAVRPNYRDSTNQAIGPASNQTSAAPAQFAPPADALPVSRAAEHSPSFVVPASAEMPAPPATAAAPALDGLSAARDPRQLGPPKTAVATPDASIIRQAASRSFLPDFGMPVETMYTTGTALAIVVGLFLLCVWALRRGARSSSVLLSGDVARVLGRVPLAARQFADLLQVGNKLLLISVTSSGTELLTEITDPIEVDRLLGICKQKDARSSSVEFDDMFRQLAEETAPDGFLGEETIRLDARAAAGAYAAQRKGGRLA
jgi:flagellar biogenesis protein FliO